MFSATVHGEEKENMGFSICIVALLITLKSPHNHCSRRCKMPLFSVISLPKDSEHNFQTTNGYEKIHERTSGIKRTYRLG